MLGVMEAIDEVSDLTIEILLNMVGPVHEEYQNRGYICSIIPFPTFSGAGGRQPRYRELLIFYCRLLLVIPRLLRFLKQNDFDYVYLNSGINFSLAIVCRWLKIPIIWQIREILDDRSMLGRWYCCRIARYSNLVIATSRRAAEAIGSDSHIRIIHDGVSENFLNPVGADEIMALKNRWGMSDNYVVGLVAPITWSKGHFILLDALRTVLKTASNVRVVFIGGTVTPTNYHKKFRARIKKTFGLYSDAERALKNKVSDMGLNDHVRFTGWLFKNQLVTAMQAIDILVFPSTIPEGFGLPVVEAALAGKPTVSTNLGSMPELILDDYTGWLIPRNDSDELAKCILKAVSNPKRIKEMGKRARKRALNRFTSSIHKREILEIFKQLNSRFELQKE